MLFFHEIYQTGVFLFVRWIAVLRVESSGSSVYCFFNISNGDHQACDEFITPMVVTSKMLPSKNLSPEILCSFRAFPSDWRWKKLTWSRDISVCHTDSLELQVSAWRGLFGESCYDLTKKLGSLPHVQQTSVKFIYILWCRQLHTAALRPVTAPQNHCWRSAETKTVKPKSQLEHLLLRLSTQQPNRRAAAVRRGGRERRAVRDAILVHRR